MRPFMQEHRDPSTFVNYMLRPGSEFLGGTVPVKSQKEIVRRFEALRRTKDNTKVYRHITVSLEKGLIATSPLWLRIAKMVINKLGLNPDGMPWIAARHQDTDCDHIHIGLSLQDIFGRLHQIVSPDKRCENAHLHICEMLGLPKPEYFREVDASRMDPATPKRRRRSKHKKALYTDLQYVFKNAQPATLAALDEALSKLPGEFRVTFSPNGAGIPSFNFSNSHASIRGGQLGRAWWPSTLNARLAMAAKLRRVRERLEIDELFQIFKNPRMENIVDQILARSDPARTAFQPADHPEPTQNDGQARPRPARTAGSSGPTGRPAGVAQRDAGQFVERPVGSTSAISGGTGQVDGTNGGNGEPDQRHGSEIGGEPAAAEQETGPRSFNLERAPRPTIGSLLAEVCALAAKRLPGWRLRVLPKSQQVGIAFADRSAAIVDQHSAIVVNNGKEALAFQADYSAVVEPPEQKPDIEAGPDF